MLQENLKVLRKSKGITQEELAERLHVVRQTVSKWEKGLSVPDAEMLSRIADLFEVPVSKLLGDTMESAVDGNLVAAQLARINEQLAIKNRRAKRIWQSIIAIITTIVISTVAILIFSTIDPNSAESLVTEYEEFIEPYSVKGE